MLEVGEPSAAVGGLILFSFCRLNKCTVVNIHLTNFPYSFWEKTIFYSLKLDYLVCVVNYDIIKVLGDIFYQTSPINYIKVSFYKFVVNIYLNDSFTKF